MEQISKINWSIKPFNELTPLELYDVLQLRQTVFVVEQNCPYLDADGKDVKAFHVLGYNNNSSSGSTQQLVATSRLLPSGISYDEVSIGRVATHPSVRMTGVGKELMEYSLKYSEILFGKQPIRIGAQKYLKRFYESFGFVDVGKEYLEDGIPHLIMLRNA